MQEPFMPIVFGNFFEPAYSDRNFRERSMERLRDLGFNAVILDSKAWEDFAVRFAGGEASRYVEGQEHMMRAAAACGLPVTFLALYMCGDNLYPHIRTSPPRLGEAVVYADGRKAQWPKYWSDQAREVQAAHVAGLLDTYGAQIARIRVKDADEDKEAKERIPLVSMWDPVCLPSFDEEGRARYIHWLRAKYGTIERFNAAYGTRHTAFETLVPEDWWFSLAFADREDAPYDAEDVHRMTRAFRMFADNMLWRSDELAEYFADMERRLRALNPALYLMPNLSQWNHYLNPDTRFQRDLEVMELWDTATRGLDMRRIAPHVDTALYTVLPVGSGCESEPYAVTCQCAHMRSLNPGRPFMAGVYWGRFLYGDIYRFVTPAETLGSIVGSGATGVMTYGWGGMDDGGVLHRLDEGFMASLREANAWARRVIPKLGRRVKSRVAILYPTATSVMAPFKVAFSEQARTDFLGLYRACRDWGYDPEIVEAQDLEAGLDADVLLIPEDPCYPAMPRPEAEEGLRRFVHAGGWLLHGTEPGMAGAVFPMGTKPTEGSCMTYRGEGGIPGGRGFMGLEAGAGDEVVARWREDGEVCICVTPVGSGGVFRMGFPAGYAFASRTMPHVPYSQGNRELYPLPLMDHPVLRDFLQTHAAMDAPFALRDVECSRFENGWIVVNHRSTAVTMHDMQDMQDILKKGRRIGTWDSAPSGQQGRLEGHSCACLLLTADHDAQDPPAS